MRHGRYQYRRNVKPAADFPKLADILAKSKNGTDAVKNCKAAVADLDLESYNKDEFGKYIVETLQIDNWGFTDSGATTVPVAQLRKPVADLYKSLIKAKEPKKFNIGSNLLKMLSDYKGASFTIDSSTDVDYIKFILASLSFAIIGKTELAKKKSDVYVDREATISVGNSTVSFLGLYGGQNNLEKMEQIQKSVFFSAIGFPTAYVSLDDKNPQLASALSIWVPKAIENYMVSILGIKTTTVKPIPFIKDNNIINRDLGLADLIYIKAYAYGIQNLFQKGYYEAFNKGITNEWQGISVAPKGNPISQMFTDIVEAGTLDTFQNSIPNIWKKTQGARLNSILSQKSKPKRPKRPKKPTQQIQTPGDDMTPWVKTELLLMLGVYKNIETNANLAEYGKLFCHHIQLILEKADQDEYNLTEVDKSKLNSVYEKFCQTPAWDVGNAWSSRIPDTGAPF